MSAGLRSSAELCYEACHCPRFNGVGEAAFVPAFCIDSDFLRRACSSFQGHSFTGPVGMTLVGATQRYGNPSPQIFFGLGPRIHRSGRAQPIWVELSWPAGVGLALEV